MINPEEIVARFNRDHGLEGMQLFPTSLTAVAHDERIAEFRARYQSYNLVRKLCPDSVPEEQRKAAFTSFLENQKRGREFNSRELDYDWVDEAKYIIARLLPPLEWVEDEIWPLCKFGPGTFNGAGSNLEYSLHYKIGADQTSTRRCLPLYLKVIAEHFPRLRGILEKGRRLKYVDGNRLSHVAKDANKCRPISIEPSCNVFLQQGVGTWMMNHFRREGFLDLYGGQAVNREKASLLSNGTIDLSSASDTIYVKLVKELLPDDWYHLLDTIRSSHWSFRDLKGRYENFSSQGNAFTFALESLIFKAICVASTGLPSREVTVYGDDMILPVEHCPKAILALTQAGFVVNDEKSYYGQHDDERKYFRESCGADYYMGVNVTPFYIRSKPKSLSELAVVYNRLYEAWPTAKRALSFIVMSIPTHMRKFVLVGPQAFITDKPESFDPSSKVLKLSSLNSVISTYSNWFWDVGPLAGLPVSNRAYVDSPVKIKARDLLCDDTRLAEFLYGGSEVLPRKSRPTSRVTYVTRADGYSLGQLRVKGARAPWWVSRHPSR